jgi:type I restriction enzyme M protein
MVSHLSEEGTASIVLPHGVLFRGGSEGHIRQYMIEELNCIDSVIGLPENIFYGTSIPTCILVLKKCRKNSNDILFIDASQHFEKVKTSNVMREEHIAKIVDIYKKRINEEKYSNVASLEFIKTNDWNLNIPRYVDSFEVEKRIDLEELTNRLKELNQKMIMTDSTIVNFCNELNIPPPLSLKDEQ